MVDLVRRLRVLETLQQHPEIATVPIPPIVYITGLERSGTTVLHNLLALHRDARALRRWELLEPVPPPETATYETDPRIARVQDQADVLRGTILEHMHWVNATDPEECVCGFIDSVSMLAWAAGPAMPRWWQFLTEADVRTAFESYRRVVQLLLWKHPFEPGGFLVLKAPQIARQVTKFADAFPEARFVITDRDPYRCTVSLAVLGHAIAGWFCETNPLTHDGHRSRITSLQVSSKLAGVAGFTTDAPSRAMHVSPSELVRRGPFDRRGHALVTLRTGVARRPRPRTRKHPASRSARTQACVDVPIGRSADRQFGRGTDYDERSSSEVARPCASWLSPA